MIDKNLPLNALKAFSAVYEAGGIRPASRVLNVTHSTISRHVRFLEKWIGVPLLNRDSSQRSLVFTTQGKKLGRATVQNLTALSNAIGAIKETRSRNSVTISTAPSFASRWLLPRMVDFNALHPSIEVSVIAQQRLTDPSGIGADIGIRMGTGVWDDAEYRLLMDDVLYPVASPSYLEKHGLGDGFDCLRGGKLLHDRDPQASWKLWRETFKLDWMDANSGPRFASSDLVLDAAVKGMGVALARGRLAEFDVAEGRLMRLCGDVSVPIRGAYWFIRTDKHQERKVVSVFVDWLKEQSGNLGCV